MASHTSARAAFADWCMRVNARMPFFGFAGLALWIAWFGVAYNTSPWISSSSTTLAPVSAMFGVSTVAHVLALGLLAVLSKRATDLVSRRWFLVLAGGVAAVGCLAVGVSSSAQSDLGALFCVGAAATGAGTAVLCIDGGVLLCAMRPWQAVSTVLKCEIVAALVQLVVNALPQALAFGVFAVLPLASALCLVVATFRPVSSYAQESSRLQPQSTFARFLTVVFVLGIAASFSRGMYFFSTSPAELSQNGIITKFITAVLLVALLVALAGAVRMPHFASWFYPSASAVVVALVILYLFPVQISLGVIISSIAVKLLEVVLWCSAVYIVYRAKVSAVSVVALGRMTFSLGAAVGNKVGGMCAVGGALHSVGSVILFVLMFAALLLTFLLFSEKQADRLLAAIPDSDLLGGTDEADSMEDVAPQGAPASAPADERDGREEDAEAVRTDAAPDAGGGNARQGRWKAWVGSRADEKGLTAREKEVLFLLVRGSGTRSISEKLCISVYTTRAHVRNIYTKFDVHSRQELMDLFNPNAS